MAPLFKIQLAQDKLIMQGSQSESVGCILCGQLILTLTKPIKLREIRMIFQGKSKVAWTESIYTYIYLYSIV